MRIDISNHPNFENLLRFYEIRKISMDLHSFKLEGFVFSKIKDEKSGDLVTPVNFNKNGDYKELTADNTTLVEGIGEFEYIKKLKIAEIASIAGKNLKEIDVEDVIASIVSMSVAKQDKLNKFNV